MMVTPLGSAITIRHTVGHLWVPALICEFVISHIDNPARRSVAKHASLRYREGPFQDTQDHAQVRARTVGLGGKFTVFSEPLR